MFKMTSCSAALVLALCVLALPAAQAGQLEDIFAMEVCRQVEGAWQCVGAYIAPDEEIEWNPTIGAWEWELTADMPIECPNLGCVAILEEGSFARVFPSTGRGDDPEVNLGFSMQAGNALTSFTVRSALVSFTPIDNATGQTSVGITLSDSGDMEGAELVGSGPLGGAYLAQYNGFVPNGTTLSENIHLVSADPFDSNSADADSGWVSIPGTVSNMSSQLSFTLTANDFASGTSYYQIIPEPASLLLVAASVFAIRRR